MKFLIALFSLTSSLAMETVPATPTDATELSLFPAFAGHHGSYPHIGAFNGRPGAYGPYNNHLAYNNLLGAYGPGVNHLAYNGQLGVYGPGVNHLAYNGNLPAYGPYNNPLSYNGYGQRYLANALLTGFPSHPNFPIDPSMASAETE